MARSTDERYKRSQIQVASSDGYSGDIHKRQRSQAVVVSAAKGPGDDGYKTNGGGYSGDGCMR